MDTVVTDTEAGPAARALHASGTSDWGTPPSVVGVARRVLGGVDLDAASSAYWHRHSGVQARGFFSAEDSALDESASWRERGQSRRPRVFLNPPGDKRGELVKAFWRRLCAEWLAERIDSAVWVGFSLEQLVSLQMHDQRTPTPLESQFGLAVPSSRLRFLRPDPAGGDPSAAAAPTHGNYIVHLPSHAASRRAVQRERWHRECSQLGWAVR